MYDCKREWMTDREFRAEYEGLEEEFAPARAGLSRAKVARTRTSR